MRNLITVIFVAATLLVGCKSATMKTSTAPTVAGASTASGTNAPAATPSTPTGPNTPDQTLAENKLYGNVAGVVIVLLTIAAIKRC